MASKTVITITEFEAWLLARCPVYEEIAPERYCVPVSEWIGLEITTPLSTDGAPPVGKDPRCRIYFVTRHDYARMNPMRFQKLVAPRSDRWQRDWAHLLENAFQTFVEQREDFHRRLQDNDSYRKEWSSKIENVKSWPKFKILLDLHDRLSLSGCWLTTKQETAIMKFQPGQPRKLPPPNRPGGSTSATVPAPTNTAPIAPTLLAAVERLLAAAETKGEQWTIDFAKGIRQRLKSGHPLTPRQDDTFRKKLSLYGLSLAIAVA